MAACLNSTPQPPGMTPAGTPRLAVDEAKRDRAAVDLREPWGRRELLRSPSWRDAKIRYKQAATAWAVLGPLLTLVIFALVFNRMLGVERTDPTLPNAVFSVSGLVRSFRPD